LIEQGINIAMGINRTDAAAVRMKANILNEGSALNIMPIGKLQVM